MLVIYDCISLFTGKVFAVDKILSAWQERHYHLSCKTGLFNFFQGELIIKRFARQGMIKVYYYLVTLYF